MEGVVTENTGRLALHCSEPTQTRCRGTETRDRLSVWLVDPKLRNLVRQATRRPLSVAPARGSR